ncbi:hypothetical protein L6164_029428 [Bauhinia variegata]|uniref:Uncharacterized protein n=1 Tax=Bauhinia variegata TaxID=167791 RepID=A0ACB9L9L9_BAUVA|nr:hypothetical protein L6164_029428 [Bauhinia variegata]
MSSSTLLPPTILILAILSLSFAGNVAEPAGCSADFATLAHQNNLSTNCKKLRTLGAELGWNYHHDSTNFTHIDILFGAKLKLSESHPSGWLAWGVNPGPRPEMIGTKAIIGIVHENGTMIVKTYEITNETKIGCRLLPGALGGIRVTDEKISYDDKTEFYTVFARLNLPSDGYNIAKLNHVWQVGYAVDNGVEPKKHPITLQNVDSSETIDLTSGNGRSTSQHLKSLREVHGVLCIVGWGTLLPIGVIGARYFKVSPFQKEWWFDLHIICQSSGYLIGTAGWAIGLWLGHASRYYFFYTHRVLAIFIFTLATLQILALRLRPNVKDPYRKYWNMYHHFVGYATLVLIFINIFRGISILRGGDAWKWVFVGILAFLGAVTLALEVFNWAQFLIGKLQKKNQKPNEDAAEKKESGKVQPAPSPINMSVF